MNLSEFSAETPDGSFIALDEYIGKVVLVVNTATGCGFTPQYEDLERIYAAYRDAGFELLDFPCNQFANQAPGTDEEIHKFCTLKFGTEFPQFKKIEVNGPDAHPLFVAMAQELPFSGWGKGPRALAMRAVGASVDKAFGKAAYIKWNFTKFLFDRQGKLVARFEPTARMADVEAAIVSQLNL